VAFPVAGSVEGGREWASAGEWNEEGDVMGGGGRGEGVIREATFQKSSKLSTKRYVRLKQNISNEMMRTVS
jgi:hypothetical protein